MRVSPSWRLATLVGAALVREAELAHEPLIVPEELLLEHLAVLPMANRCHEYGELIGAWSIAPVDV